MAIIQAQICQCDECAKRWLAEGDLPKRCSRCKSTKWNASGRVEITPAVERRVLDPNLGRGSRMTAEGEIYLELEEEVIALVESEAKAAGVTRDEYIAELIRSGPESALESERIQTMMAAAVAAQTLEAELREEVRELKRKLRASREADSAPEPRQEAAQSAGPSGTKCPHNQVWRMCKWAACREADPALSRMQISPAETRQRGSLERSTEPIPKPTKKK